MHILESPICGSKFIFLVLYVDDILLAISDVCLLIETKKFLLKNFDMKDMGEAGYVLGIEIVRDRSRGLLGLSQKNYISKILQRFDMSTCKAGESPISKGDKLHKDQCPRNEVERRDMEKRPYAKLVGSLMYAQVYTRLDIAFAVGVLSRYQSNPGFEYWVAGKKVLRYLQRTKGHFLVFKRLENIELEVIGFSDSDYRGCPDDLKSTSGYIFMLAGLGVQCLGNLLSKL